MKVAEEEDVELGDVRAALAEAESAGAAGVDDDTGFAVIPDEIAGGGALRLQLRAAGAEYLDGDAGCAAGLRRCWRGCVERQERDGDEQDCGRKSLRVHFGRTHLGTSLLWPNRGVRRLDHHGLVIFAEDGSQCAGDFAHRAVALYGFQNRGHEIATAAGTFFDGVDSLLPS